MKRNHGLTLLGVVSVLSLAGSARANVLTITSTPQENTGSFLHNVFHTADSNGGAGGSILAWFDLDTTQSSTWDPVSGALSLHVNVYSDAGLSNLIGTAHGVHGSDALEGSDFNAFDNSMIGVIDWNIDLTGASAFATYMTGKLGAQPSGGWTLGLQYADHNYVTSSQGYRANSWENGAVTLWGADGTRRANGYQFDNAILGTDLVFTARAVPIPGAMALGAIGLGFAGLIRRRMGGR